MPVNAQDIVDEEFSKLDEDDYIEFQPDLTKITITLEEMAPHTNARYGRNEIGMGNMFADYFKQIARYNSERKGWYDGVNARQHAPARHFARVGAKCIK